MMRRWLEGWRLCRGLEPVTEYDDFYAAVLRLPGRSRELFTRTDDPATVDRLARALPADTWLTVTTGDAEAANVARWLAAAGARTFDEYNTLMSIDLLDHPRGTGEVESDGPLDYVRVEIDGVVAARGMATIVGTDAVIHDIHTDPAYRRRGLGSAVMQALAGRALERGARTGLLMATAAGFHLYRTLGWTAEATMVTASGPAGPRAVSGDLGAVLASR
jgi:ribosomal protein S18 acetylase RimI-like enzyme